MSTDRASGSVGPAPTPWRKSSYSGNTGNCVEVAELADGYRAIRNSKDPARSVLISTPAGWAAFTAGIRSGNFD